MNCRLISLDYNVPSSEMRLEQLPLVIGHASDADIRLNDRSVGSHHCRIEEVGGQLVVRDLGSVHGTFVNSCRVEEAAMVPGDELSIGLCTFFVQPCAEAAPPAVVRPERELAAV